MAHFCIEEETLPPDALVELQRRRLGTLLRTILPDNAFYVRKLAAIRTADLANITLTDLPFTTRAELQRDQAKHPPYGTNLTYPLARYHRLHQSSGSTGEPLRWLDTPESWAWWKKCWGVIYRAAGVRPDDRLFFPFSFGPFIGFWGAFDAAVELGNLSLAGGGLTTTARLAHLLSHRVTFICCTPTYAMRLAEVARDQEIDLAGSSVRGLIVAGEPGGHVPETRQRIERTFGARLFDHAGLTEAGPWGFECEESSDGMHVLESEFLAEIVDPKSGEPRPDGESGELVLTNLGRFGSPLLRYRTGDQARLIRSRCACGRWFARAEDGILGRIDDMLTIRGNNVFPAAVEGIVRSIDGVAEFSLEVEQDGALAELRITIEPAGGADAANLAGRVADAVRDRLHFRPMVSTVAPGRLPRFEMKAKRLIRRQPPTTGRPLDAS